VTLAIALARISTLEERDSRPAGAPAATAGIIGALSSGFPEPMAILRRSRRYWRRVSATERRWALVASSALVAFAPALAAGAGVQQTSAALRLSAPPPGDVFTGVSGDNATQYASEAGKHPAVFGSFITWGRGFDWAFAAADGTRARAMLHISTTVGDGGTPAITPRAIADGLGDGYILYLARMIAAHGAPVYIRLLPEMNNAHNAYSADRLNGSSRGPAYSQHEFKQAWRRVVTILRGGPVGAIDAKLQALNLPPVQGLSPAATIPISPIAFIWCPETVGTPSVASESAASYWPGSAYVDWVGTDFYSAFPNFAGLNAFYRSFPRKPFVFAEWAIWRNGSAAFVHELFSWINAHKRVKMLLYNQGYGRSSPLLLSNYPTTWDAIRNQLSDSRFLAYTREWQPTQPGSTGPSG
jgi:hypothetical protein